MRKCIKHLIRIIHCDKYVCWLHLLRWSLFLLQTNSVKLLNDDIFLIGILESYKLISHQGTNQMKGFRGYFVGDFLSYQYMYFGSSYGPRLWPANVPLVSGFLLNYR